MTDRKTEKGKVDGRNVRGKAKKKRLPEKNPGKKRVQKRVARRKRGKRMKLNLFKFPGWDLIFSTI